MIAAGGEPALGPVDARGAKRAPGTSIDLGTIVGADDAVHGGRRVVCRSCGHTITSESARLEVDGAHEHTKENPAGLVFRIGCYRVAPGCDHLGPEVAEHTWFAGYTWQIALCRGCRIHLGWAFRSGGARFHGLIVDRLRIEEGPAET